jgi:large subunit ribosomal protein L24e
MAKCNYCGNEMKQGTGKMYVFKTGKLINFCSNKCEKNQIKLKRTARKFKWTKCFEKTETKSSKKDE